MNRAGWIKSYRKAQDHNIWVDQNAWRVFQWLLWNVDYETGKASFGRKQIAQGTGLNEATVYKVTQRLTTKYQAIDMKSNNKFTEFSVLNWARYQQDDPKVTQEVTTKEQVAVTKSNTLKEYKNKEIRNIYTPLQEYLTAFNSKFNKSYKPTKGRELKLKLRLKSYSLEQILQALDGLSKSKFHMGENDRGWQADPDFLIRSEEQIDKFLNSGTKLSNTPTSSLLDMVLQAKGEYAKS